MGIFPNAGDEKCAIYSHEIALFLLLININLCMNHNYVDILANIINPSKLKAEISLFNSCIPELSRILFLREFQ
jgi:hypothetical protein